MINAICCCVPRKYRNSNVGFIALLVVIFYLLFYEIRPFQCDTSGEQELNTLVKKHIASNKELESQISNQLSSIKQLKSQVSDLETKNEELKKPNSPKITKADHVLAVIVPFRDRFDELLIFGPWITEFLTKQLGKDNFKIFIINQSDNYRFNRASLINVGYHVAKENNCDYMVMHDVDLLPNNQGLNYRYPGKEPKIVHLASPEYHPMYHYPNYVGGVLLCSLKNFEALNGMSNKYWGWGREDDEFHARIKEAQLQIERPTGLITGYDTFQHIHDKEHRKRDYHRTKEQKTDQWKRDKEGGYGNVEYDIKKIYSVNINENNQVTVVNVELKCDTKATPWCK